VPNDLARVVLELLGQRERTRLAHVEHHRPEESPYRRIASMPAYE
jgi:hypothetical protein